ncbi:FAD:protein FMN transferase [Prolixibacteraceae bacterium A06]|uniref:FAD:protein FMN transferase n=2 Tax=Gaoshiqia sediminis TaxID=2986998 RepID=A0AA41YCY8_9BACT|nr:FAD:protein FMN transferase [Gaoshiqia sediminis]
MKHSFRSITWLVMLSILLLSGCQHEKQYFEVSGMTHTPYHVKYEYSQSLEKEIKAEFANYYHSLNPFDSLSIISQINRNEEVEVDSLFAFTFRKVMQVSEQTNGLFDVTCAPLINLWGFGFSKRDSITQQVIDSIRSFVGYQKIRLEGSRVVKDDPRMLLNFSAVGDGGICDLVARLFDRHNIQNYMVEVGGEVVAKGVNAKGQHWRIGISKPVDDPAGMSQELEQILHLKQRVGVATSGDYRNFYVKDGKKYAHTINPTTGYPADQDILSATIIAPDCLTADAYATAFMVMGSAAARQLKEQVPEIEYFIIFTDEHGNYATEHSPGMEPYLSE